MAHVILKNGREFYTKDQLNDWKDINEKPQFLEVNWKEVYKGHWNDNYSDVNFIINKDHIAEINP